MGKKILILGGGISGLECASLLFENNEVWIVEKADHLGGMSKDYSCKATDKCNFCGWCLTDKTIRKVNDNKNKINFLFNTELKKVKKLNGRFSVSFSNGSVENFDKIIIACGSKEFNAVNKPRFGYNRYNNVITGYDLEQDLRKHDFSKNSAVAFIQCVGSRDESIEALYCSKVCCRYALRMANYISYKYPEIKITVFYMDLQLQGKDIDRIYEDIKENENINFVRGIPSFIEETPEKKLTVRLEDTQTNHTSSSEFDKIILSVGLCPNPDNEKLSRILGINLDSNGFIAADKSSMTNIEGIYAIGTSSGPNSINQTLESSKIVSELL
ncbi:MAG: FAD-dependent oxidoreductase [Victivallales bacterium]|nr:FAD-dependent oxidoreductase [Victivallales bacterium]MCF7888865.1 FAD-dependent oxidoreductase [Victivallales bacterium]